MTADKTYRLLVLSTVWLIGLASMVGYGIIAATMENPTFRSVFVIVFGVVMTLAMVIFMTVVFLVKRKAT